MVLDKESLCDMSVMELAVEDHLPGRTQGQA